MQGVVRNLPARVVSGYLLPGTDQLLLITYTPAAHQDPEQQGPLLVVPLYSLQLLSLRSFKCKVCISWTLVDLLTLAACCSAAHSETYIPSFQRSPGEILTRPPDLCSTGT